MPLDPIADLEQLFADDFSVAATWNGATTVRGIFDATFSSPDIGDIGVESNDPMFTCRTSEIPGAAEDDTLVISGTTYKIKGIMPDGTGVTELVLEEQ